MSAADQTQQGVPSGRWTADAVHSWLGFEVQYAVATFKGEVLDFEATLDDGKLTGKARIESLRTKEENLQAHLLSPEFFDAQRHPEVTFSTSEIRREGDKIEIDWEITIKGIIQDTKVTGLATGPAVDHFGASRFGLALRAVVDRTAFDMKWNMPLPDGSSALSNEVTLRADLALVAQSED